MTKVLFCHGAADRLQAAAAWLMQLSALNPPAAALVYASDAGVAERVDRLLWTQPATGFLAHCRADSPLAPQTPILIASRLDDLPQEKRLLNLSDELPPGFSRFENLVEIVSQDDAVRLPARERVKFYRDRGYDIEFRDLDKTPL
ncbi:MAG: DNA polymerase III subunit chi [Betaproteobacteria bacterium]|nr:DNA polymerase III subunit chi [Betaproteobacteria bacterium]